MLLSRKFVSDYIDLPKDLTIEEIANDMTSVGNEYDYAGKLINCTNLIVGEVLECIEHPDSDHLHVCKVNIGAEVLTVPNFTLYANAFTGRRPSFTTAMPFEEGKRLYDYLISKPLFDAQHGVFGADMKIDSICDGPINIIIESQGGKAKV